MIFSAAQAVLAAKAGATYVSPFVGRLDDQSVAGLEVVRSISELYRIYGVETQVLSASIRSVQRVVRSWYNGAQVVTMPPNTFGKCITIFLRKMVWIDSKKIGTPLMQNFNKITLDITVAILDFLYKGRDYPRFWVLEEIARAPYFAFLSVLHFRESMGLRGPEHLYLMKEHFDQSINETEHLEYMESRGGNTYFIDRFVAKHLVLIYYWVNVVYYWVTNLSLHTICLTR